MKSQAVLCKFIVYIVHGLFTVSVANYSAAYNNNCFMKFIQVQFGACFLHFIQGTVLDRIDYNIEQSCMKTEEGLKQLHKAEQYQKKNRKMLVILILFVIVIVLIVVLIGVKSHQVSLHFLIFGVSVNFFPNVNGWTCTPESCL